MAKLTPQEITYYSNEAARLRAQVKLYITEQSEKEQIDAYYRRLKFQVDMETVIREGKIDIEMKEVTRAGIQGKVKRYHVTSTYFNKVTKWFLKQIEIVGKMLNVSGRVDPTGTLILKLNSALFPEWSDEWVRKTDLANLYKYLLALMAYVSAQLYNYRKLNRELNQDDNKTYKLGSYLPYLMSKDVASVMFKYGANTPSINAGKVSAGAVDTQWSTYISSLEKGYVTLTKKQINALFSNMIFNTGVRSSRVPEGSKRTVVYVNRRLGDIFPNMVALAEKRGEYKYYTKRTSVADAVFGNNQEVIGNSALAKFVGLVAVASNAQSKLIEGGAQFAQDLADAARIHEEPNLLGLFNGIEAAKEAFTKARR